MKFTLNRIILFCSLFLLSTLPALAQKPKAIITLSDSCANSEFNASAIKSTFSGTDSIVAWSWKFPGNASISTASTDSVKALIFKDTTNKATFTDTIWLKVTTKAGLSDSTFRIFQLKYNGLANFTTISRCQDSSISFINLTDSISVRKEVSYWNFGDSTHDTLHNTPPDHYYFLDKKTGLSTANTYYPILKVKWKNGCSNSTNITANPTYVYANPAARIVVPLKDCQNTTVIFTDNDSSYNSPLWTHFWDFGDGNGAKRDSGNVDSVRHTYSATGAKKVRYISVTQNGCRDTAFTTLTINPQPTAKFAFSNACQNASTVFTNSSGIGAGGTITSYLWDFGDGSTDTAKNPLHTFKSPKGYLVTLTVTSNNGCTAQDTHTVTISRAPVLRIFPVNSCAGTVSTIKDNTSYIPGDSATKWAWTYGDASPGTTTAFDTTTHKYAKPGTYHVILTATLFDGCMDTVGAFISIYNLPVAKFSVSGNCSGQNVTFTDNSTVTGSSIVSEVWTFDDSVNATVTNPDTGTGSTTTHFYDSAGIYNKVKLRAISAFGCIDSTRQSITILRAPDTSFSSTAACQNSLVQFKYTGRQTKGMKYSWNFGNPRTTADTSTLMNPSFSYDSGGIYTVQVNVKDLNGCNATGAHNINVFPKPTLHISTDNVCADSGITFTGSYTFASNIPNPPAITNYSWDFGDTTTANTSSSTFVHSYKFTGFHTVTLTATTSDGCTQTFDTIVQIYALPVAQFTPPVGCNVSNLQFVDNSTGNTIVSWQWDFLTDFTTDTNQNTSYIFQNTDTSNPVTLTVVTNHGCRAEVTHNAITYQSPSSDFNINLPTPYRACALDSTFQFFSSSSAAIGETTVASFLWIFGDGRTDTAANPFHGFPQKDSVKKYNIRLVSFSHHGCPDTTKIIPVNPNYQITIDPKPVAAFTLKNSLKCAGLSVSFYDSSQFAFGVSPGIIYWDFGDGNTDYPRNFYPQHIYADTGVYNMFMYRKNDVANSSCQSDTFRYQVHILPTPVADFTWNGTCQNTPTQFGDLSKVFAPSRIDTAKYQWDFADGFGFQHQDSSPTHIYTDAGSYKVTLQVYSTLGACPAKTTKIVQVQQAPTAKFIATPNPGGNDTAKIAFEDSSVGINIIKRVWDFGDSTKLDINPANADTHQFRLIGPIDTGTFRVKLLITNSFGCSDSAFQYVQIKQILKLDGHFPNVFSPNGDGINDVWHPKTKGVFSYKCFIFDRWGQMVYSTTNWDDPGWKGDYLGNGVRVTEGVYVYYAILTDYDNQVIRKVTGTITLIR